MLEHDVDGKGDETELSKNIVKLFDKTLASLKFQDLEQSILSMEHADANQILDFSATTHVIGSPRLLDEVKPQIGFFLKIKSTSGVYHNVEGQGHVKVQFESGEINNIKDVLYVLSVNKNLLSIGKITNKSHLTTFNYSQCLIISKIEPHKIIVQGIRSSENGLYKLVGRKPSINPKKHQASIIEETNIVRFWHMRLEHLNFQSLHYLSFH